MDRGLITRGMVTSPTHPKTSSGKSPFLTRSRRPKLSYCGLNGIVYNSKRIPLGDRDGEADGMLRRRRGLRLGWCRRISFDLFRVNIAREGVVCDEVEPDVEGFSTAVTVAGQNRVTIIKTQNYVFCTGCIALVRKQGRSSVDHRWSNIVCEITGAPSTMPRVNKSVGASLEKPLQGKVDVEGFLPAQAAIDAIKDFNFHQSWLAALMNIPVKSVPPGLLSYLLRFAGEWITLTVRQHPVYEFEI
ncbi:hypothetical protein Bca4012_037480 [Brassica carinata]